MLEKILYFLLDFNYGRAVLILFLGFIVYLWAWAFRNIDFSNFKKRYSQLSPEQLFLIKETIKHMEGIEFEEFCTWLFKKSGKYNSVILTQAAGDGGKDIILDNKIYVECKRYTEKATVTEEYMIGREICQKLVGAMVGDGFKEGIIMTTGSMHRNAWDYILNLEKNAPDIKIDFLLLDDIMKMVRQINSTEIFNVVRIYEKESEGVLE